MLVNGDCLESLPNYCKDKSIDLIFCDLPFGILKTEWDCEIDLDKLWVELKRIKKPTTPIFFCCNAKMGYKIMKSAIVPFKFDFCWVKPTTSGHLLSGKRPMVKHEYIYVFYDKQPCYDLSSHTRLGGQSKKQYSFESAYGSKAIYTEHPIKNKSAGCPRWSPPLPTSVLEYTSSRKHHQTEKPVELIQYLLKYWSKEGDVVLDPTMGSGSCGVACKLMNRKFIGFEKDKKIYAIAIKRYGDGET